MIQLRDTTDSDMVVHLQELDKYKTQLLYHVAHEIRNPLNSIISLQERLSQFITTEICESVLTPSLNSSRLLLSLINDMLDFAQIRKGQLRITYQKTKLRTVLEDCISLNTMQANNRGILL